MLVSLSALFLGASVDINVDNMDENIITIMKYSYLPTLISSPSSPTTVVARSPLILLGVSAIFNVLFMYTWYFQPLGCKSDWKLYSPVQDVVSYHPVKFNPGFAWDMPIYEQEPTDEVDQAWAELYQYTVSRVSKSEAMEMANRTYPIPHEEGSYLSGLDVFHQLHCLDMVRMSLHPERYPGVDHPHRKLHVAHCLGHVRQALMCAADITPISWQWNEQAQTVRRRDDVVHTCRNFEAIQEWAKERFVSISDEELKVYVDDGLE
ncbi:hypothetical protein EDD85DRAFT_138830 [Armillaria nabsnona]|nr:hypothetical protein EDD85DRAFT_138830 [Armillaria nabsnona]